MKKTILYCVLILSLLIPAIAEETANNEFSMLVPIGFYTSDTGIAGGGLYQKFFSWGLNFSIVGFYTQKNQANTFYTLDYFTPESQWWLRYGGSARYYPEYYYGSGPETDLSDEEIYTSMGFSQYIKAFYRLIPGLYAGPFIRYRYLDVVDPQTGGLIDQGLVAGDNGYQVLRFGTGIGTGRDPLKFGDQTTLSYEAAANYLTTLSGDSVTGFEGISDFRIYYAFPGAEESYQEHQLTLQQQTSISTGDIPFAELPSLGGANQMRGYAADRFRDSSAAFIQADYRFPIYKRFRGAVFFGAGNVGDNLLSMGEGGIKPAWGGGLRYQAGPTSDTAFRLDAAWTPEGFGLYFTFGEAY